MHLPQNVLNVIVGCGIIVGAIQCFMGYRIFKIVLGLTGFILGGAGATVLGFAVFQNIAIAILAGLASGLLGAALVVALYFVGVFLTGAFLGGLVGTVLWAGAGITPQPVILLGFAVVAGALALAFRKLMLIVSTGFGGAWSVVTGIAYFTTRAPDFHDIARFFHSAASPIAVPLVCWLALGLAGVIVQYGSRSMKDQVA